MKPATEIRKQMKSMTTSQLEIIKARVERIQHSRIQEQSNIKLSTPKQPIQKQPVEKNGVAAAQRKLKNELLKAEKKKKREQLMHEENLRKQRAIVHSVLEVYSLLKNNGISMSEFLKAAKKYKFPKPGEGSSPIRRTQPRKYRNPENINETWSGMGRKPLWFMKALEAGRTPDELLNPYERINSSIAD